MAKNKDSFIVDVIAATEFDTRLGVYYLQKSGINDIISCSISNSPEEQTKLQKNPQMLMNLVYERITKSIANNAKCVLIYCNSLSGALDLIQLRKIFAIPIVTPIDVYIDYATQFKKFGLIAANCQSVFNIEKIIVQNNPSASVVGLGSLSLVNAVEEKWPSLKIINDFQLINQFSIFRSHGCEVVIIGCTHFHYFLDDLYDALQDNKFSLKIIEPSQKMLNKIMDIKAKYVINHP